jgi:uncharacterized protein (DUF1697 family)
MFAFGFVNLNYLSDSQGKIIPGKIHTFMNTFVAMLRGINVSGQKMIKMEALRVMCGALKFQNTQTYIQSGNIIFQSKESDTIKLEKKISKEIKEEFGFDVPVLVKEISELKKVLKNNPFVYKRNEDITKLHVTFLETVPDKKLFAKIEEMDFSDEYVLSGKNIYLFCPNGYGNTKLNNNFFENKLKTKATSRNWKTVNELVRIGESIIGK